MPFVYIETKDKNVFAKVSGGCFAFLSSRSIDFRSNNSFQLYEKENKGKGRFKVLPGRFYNPNRDKTINTLKNTKVYFPCIEHIVTGKKTGDVTHLLDIYKMLKGLEWCKDYISFDLISKSFVVTTNAPADVFILVLQTMRNLLSFFNIYRMLRNSGVNVKASCLLILAQRVSLNTLTRKISYAPVTSDSNIFSSTVPNVHSLHSFFGNPLPRLKTVSELCGYAKYNNTTENMLEPFKSKPNTFKIYKVQFQGVGSSIQTLFQENLSCNCMFSKEDDSDDLERIKEYMKSVGADSDSRPFYTSFYKTSTEEDLDFFKSIGYLSSGDLFNYIIEQFNDGVIVTIDQIK